MTDRGRLVRFPGADGGEGAVTAELVGAVEAMLFAAGAPVGIDALCAALEGIDAAQVQRAIEVVASRCAAHDRGVEVVSVAGGWQLRSQARFASMILKLRGGKPAKLSRPALELLAIVAYRQPATRADIERVRGVDSGGVLKSLLERGLIRVSGRREEPGRPLEYATTAEFLELFSLPAVAALPTLREREELLRDQAPAEE